MNVNFPVPSSPGLSTLVTALRQIFISVVSSNEAVDRILLRSRTSGAVYAVTVDDDTDPMAPVLVATLIDGKGRV